MGAHPFPVAIANMAMKTSTLFQDQACALTKELVRILEAEGLEMAIHLAMAEIPDLQEVLAGTPGGFEKMMPA